MNLGIISRSVPNGFPRFQEIAVDRDKPATTLGYRKLCKQWHKLPTSTLVGFLPSTLCHFILGFWNITARRSIDHDNPSSFGWCFRGTYRSCRIQAAAVTPKNGCGWNLTIGPDVAFLLEKPPEFDGFPSGKWGRAISTYGLKSHFSDMIGDGHQPYFVGVYNIPLIMWFSIIQVGYDHPPI